MASLYRGATISGFKHTVIDVKTLGSLATVRGTFSFALASRSWSEPERHTGGSIFSLRRGADGDWSIVTVMWGANAGPIVAVADAP